MEGCGRGGGRSREIRRQIADWRCKECNISVVTRVLILQQPHKWQHRIRDIYMYLCIMDIIFTYVLLFRNNSWFLMFMGPCIVIMFWYILPTRCTSHGIYLMFMGPCIVIMFWYIIPTRCTSHGIYLMFMGPCIVIMFGYIIPTRCTSHGIYLMFMGPCIVIMFWYINPTRCTSHGIYLI